MYAALTLHASPYKHAITKLPPPLSHPVCSNPPNGSHPTIRTTKETGDGTLGSSFEFVCNRGLRLEDGLTSILAVCTEAGWSNCSQDIKCECEYISGFLNQTLVELNVLFFT